MAWTAPRTWVAAETVTAALLNTHIRDNEKALGDPWTAYTPTLSASTTPPTLGTGSAVSGAYIAAGKLIIGRARIAFGTSGTAAGSGTYRFSLPVAAAASGETRAISSIRMFDSSANAIATPAVVIAGTTYMEFQYQATWPSGTFTVVTHAAPWAWAASDWIEVAFCYEAS
jgi:hypothetical protein